MCGWYRPATSPLVAARAAAVVWLRRVLRRAYGSAGPGLAPRSVVHRWLGPATGVLVLLSSASVMPGIAPVFVFQGVEPLIDGDTSCITLPCVAKEISAGQVATTSGRTYVIVDYDDFEEGQLLELRSGAGHMELVRGPHGWDWAITWSPRGSDGDPVEWGTVARYQEDHEVIPIPVTASGQWVLEGERARVPGGGVADVLRLDAPRDGIGSPVPVVLILITLVPAVGYYLGSLDRLRQETVSLAVVGAALSTQQLLSSQVAEAWGRAARSAEYPVGVPASLAVLIFVGIPAATFFVARRFVKTRSGAGVARWEPLENDLRVFAAKLACAAALPVHVAALLYLADVSVARLFPGFVL